MKSVYLRSCVAVACALGLAACGGGSGNLALGGSIIGLTKNGLILQNNGGPELTVNAGTTQFTFPELIGSDQSFNVTAKNPQGAKCTVANGSGKSGAYNVLSVIVTCVTDSYDLGGTVSGLDVNGLVIVNGSDRQEIPAGATSFTMSRFSGTTYVSGRVFDGAPYGVTILTQPAGRSCSVVNGVGVMGSAPVTSIQIKCA